nr:Intraflagellar transport protein 74 [Polyrhizophydium stewartii]
MPGGVNVVDRPTTQQGLGGIRPKMQGPGRQVQDVTFFQSELRQKSNLLADEIRRLALEVEQVTKENSNYATFEKRADTLAEELKELQGQLGDLNTLVDKLHTDTDLEEIERQYHQLKAKNQRESQVLDEVFMQRQQRESSIREIEKQIAEERQKAEGQINFLEPEKKAEYLRLRDENAKFVAAIEKLQEDIERQNQKAQQLQQELAQDAIKQKAVALHERLNEARDRKRELEESIKTSESESGPQEKARLLEQVKEDNLETSGMERKIAELEEQLRKLREQISQADADLDPAQGERNAKYEELLKRDREMQAFLDSFDEKRHECLTRNQEAEHNIVELLERIKTLSKKDVSNMPSKEGFQELQGDLAFKENEMQNSENTMEALIQERDRRMQDLDKVGQLETKLNAELKHLREKILSMTEEMTKIGNIDSIKKEAEFSKRKNAAEREDLQFKRDVMRSSIQALTSRYEAKKAQLHENETYTQLGALEQRLRHHEGITFGLKDYIASKTAESDYKPLAKEVAKRMDEINAQLVKLMALPPTR